jgi:hypothetical protein
MHWTAMIVAKTKRKARAGDDHPDSDHHTIQSHFREMVAILINK